MSPITIYIVHQFWREAEKERLTVSRTLEFRVEGEALAWAERKAPFVTGVAVTRQTVTPLTGEVLDAPVILARHGDLPQEFREE